MLGPSHRGHWAADAPASVDDSIDANGTDQQEAIDPAESAGDDSIYVFMGKDYSVARKQADDETVDKFVAEAMDELLDEPRSAPRRQASATDVADLDLTPIRKRKREYTIEEKQVRKNHVFSR